MLVGSSTNTLVGKVFLKIRISKYLGNFYREMLGNKLENICLRRFPRLASLGEWSVRLIAEMLEGDVLPFHPYA